MPNIEYYRKEKQKMLILLCIQGLIFYSLAFSIMKGGDSAAATAMFVMPLPLVIFVQYTALATKIEILKELQDKEKDADGVTETSPDKKLFTLRLAGILITGLAILGIVWFMLRKLTVLEQF